MSKKIVKNTIEINASLQKVWDALVNPEQTKKYMFGCEAVSDWQIGNPLFWRGEYQDKEMLFVTGFVLEIQPEKILKYSVIDPTASYPHTLENHLNVTYELAHVNGLTTLTVSQDGFEDAADGEKRYQDVYNNGDGWNPILIEIKKILEN